MVSFSTLLSFYVSLSFYITIQNNPERKKGNFPLSLMEKKLYDRAIEACGQVYTRQSKLYL